MTLDLPWLDMLQAASDVACINVYNMYTSDSLAPLSSDWSHFLHLDQINERTGTTVCRRLRRK